MYRRAGKRLLDLALIFLSVPVVLPILMLTSFLVRVRMGSPIILKQERAGKKGQKFVLFKFRSMADVRDAQGQLLPDEARLSAFGRNLRSTSLDELPALWNVMRGEMSLVGPRPLHLRYLKRYTAEQKRRHEVLPGLTGWAQVNGRNALEWEERFALDIWYVERLSLVLDLKILWKTLGTAWLKDGISHAGTSTMTEFEGTGSPSGKSREKD